MKISKKMYDELNIYDTADLEKYLKAVVAEVNDRTTDYQVRLLIQHRTNTSKGKQWN